MTATTGAPSPPSPAEVAASRAGLYRLLGRLYLQEVDRSALALLRAWPPFGAALAAGPNDDEALLARLRSEYARLFLMNVYPYESVYVDGSVMLNTEATIAVAEAYAEAGFAIDGPPRPGAPDHVGAELAFVAALAEREAAALEAGRAEAAPGWLACQRRFLAAHLASWTPVFALAAARDARHPFYRALAELTAEFVLADLDQLAGAGATPADRGALGAGAAPGLARQELAEVARHLAAPVLSGFHLSREELYRLAGRLRLPVAMLDRPKMIETLFEAAARFGQLPALLELLEAGAAGAARRYRDWTASYPRAAAVLAPWRRRADATAAGLAAMRRAAVGGQPARPRAEPRLERAREQTERARSS